MSRPKGGEGASVCVADVLGEVLSVRFLIWHDTHLAGSIVAVRVNHTRVYRQHIARTYVHARNIRAVDRYNIHCVMMATTPKRVHFVSTGGPPTKQRRLMAVSAPPSASLPAPMVPHLGHFRLKGSPKRKSYKPTKRRQEAAADGKLSTRPISGNRHFSVLE